MSGGSQVQGCLLTDLEVQKLVGEKKEMSKAINHKNDHVDSTPGSWVC